MSVRLVSDPSQDADLTNNTIPSTFFFFKIELTKALLFVRSGQAFFISRAKKILPATWLQSQPA